MGVVYHGNYAQYLEMARVEWLRVLGISYKNMEEDGIMLPVINLSINYLKPALYDDLVTVKVILNKKPAVRIVFDYEITNEAGELLATAHTVLVFMDTKRKRPTKCPQFLLDKLGY